MEAGHTELLLGAISDCKTLTEPERGSQLALVNGLLSLTRSLGVSG